MARFQEKWSKGKTGGCVVSDTPNRHTRDEHVDYYGGHLVAESIPKQEYVNLIAAAPDLLEALEALLAIVKTVPELNNKHFDQIGIQVNAALAKARGESEAYHG